MKLFTELNEKERSKIIEQLVNAFAFIYRGLKDKRNINDLEVLKQVGLYKSMTEYGCVIFIRILDSFCEADLKSVFKDTELIKETRTRIFNSIMWFESKRDIAIKSNSKIFENNSIRITVETPTQSREFTADSAIITLSDGEQVSICNIGQSENLDGEYLYPMITGTCASVGEIFLRDILESVKNETGNFPEEEQAYKMLRDFYKDLAEDVSDRVIEDISREYKNNIIDEAINNIKQLFEEKGLDVASIVNLSNCSSDEIEHIKDNIKNNPDTFRAIKLEANTNNIDEILDKLRDILDNLDDDDVL